MTQFEWPILPLEEEAEDVRIEKGVPGLSLALASKQPFRHPTRIAAAHPAE